MGKQRHNPRSFSEVAEFEKNHNSGSIYHGKNGFEISVSPPHGLQIKTDKRKRGRKK